MLCCIASCQAEPCPMGTVIPRGRGEAACCGHVLERWEHPGDIQSLSWEKCRSSTRFICYLDTHMAEGYLMEGQYIISLLSVVLIRKYCKYLSIFTAIELSLLLLWLEEGRYLQTQLDSAFIGFYCFQIMYVQFTKKFTLVASPLPSCQSNNALLILS